VELRVHLDVEEQGEEGVYQEVVQKQELGLKEHISQEMPHTQIEVAVVSEVVEEESVVAIKQLKEVLINQKEEKEEALMTKDLLKGKVMTV
jgi:hypothetical protein